MSTDPFPPIDPEVAAVHRRHPNIPQDPLPCFDADPVIEKRPQVVSVKWSRYKIKTPAHCGVCVERLAALGASDGPAPRRATFRRREGEAIRLFCSSHQEEQRRAEGLEPMKIRSEFDAMGAGSRSIRSRARRA